MYVQPNFKTKKAFREAVKAGQSVELFSPGVPEQLPDNGTVTVEGPHYPKPHTWYAQVTIENGKPIKVS